MYNSDGPSRVRYAEGSCVGGDRVAAFWVFSFLHAPAPILANTSQAQEGMEDLTYGHLKTENCLVIFRICLCPPLPPSIFFFLHPLHFPQAFTLFLP